MLFVFRNQFASYGRPTVQERMEKIQCVAHISDWSASSLMETFVVPMVQYGTAAVLLD